MLLIFNHFKDESSDKQVALKQVLFSKKIPDFEVVYTDVGELPTARDGSDSLPKLSRG